MISGLAWRLRRILGRIWVRVTAFGVLGLITALGASWLGPFLPDDLGRSIGSGSVEKILEIIATSMLTVATFSLSIMVTAFGSAQSGGTPRAIALLQSDRLTQHVMASFIGAFIYALVGIIALESGYYGDAGLLVLFVVTIAVIGLIVVMLLRWVQHLSEFGRLDDVIGRVENAAATALALRCDRPFLGGTPWSPQPPGMIEIPSVRTGHVQLADMAALDAIARDLDCRIWLCAPPGTFVHPATALACCDALPADAEARRSLEDRITDAFVIDHVRSYEQDPVFGLRALAEIGSRALSPAVNDPGTGIDILGRLLRVLAEWQPEEARDTPERPAPEFPRVLVPALSANELIYNAFDALSRDAAAQIEVASRLQEVLAAAAAIRPELRDPAATQARRAAEHAAEGLVIEADRTRIADMAARLREPA